MCQPMDQKIQYQLELNELDLIKKISQQNKKGLLAINTFYYSNWKSYEKNEINLHKIFVSCFNTNTPNWIDGAKK